MDNSGTIEKIALQLTNALTPLTDRLQHKRVLDVFAEFGLVLPQTSVTPALENAIQQTAASADELKNLVEALIAAVQTEDFEGMLTKALELIQQIKLLIESIATITNEINSIGFTGGLSPAEFTQFINELPGRLAETLIVEHMEGYFPFFYRLFELFGLITLERKNVGDTDELLPNYVEKKLHLDLLTDFLDNPLSIVENLYKWGTNNLEAELLINRLYYLFQSLGVPVARKTIADGDRPALEWMLFSLAPTKGINPPGLEATVMLNLTEGFSFRIPISEQWSVDIGISLPIEASAGLRLLPPAQLSLIPLSGTPQGEMTMKLVRTAAPGEGNIAILTLGGGSGISAREIGFGVSTALLWDTAANEAKGEFGMAGNIVGGKVIISTEGSDGFVASLLSNLDVDVDFDLGFGWNSGSGFFITGSGSLNIELPLHVNLGPIDISAMVLSLGFEDGAFPIEFSTNIKAELGPLQVTVEQIGASAKVTPVSGVQGSSGVVDLDFGFKPPNGLGLSVDAGAVKGGGYLFFDFDREEYAGALELVFSEWIALKAIGLVTTRMPDGSKGFSMIIIITVEFGTGIQLGFGFTLLGVGGLLGLNRTVRVDPLAEGVRTGSVESVMFPQDVIANAPRIISDLKQFFPTANDAFLVGPMAKIGYGTPTLVSLSLGVILEFPDVYITILGVLKVALPDEDADILRLQVNFIGRIEPSNKLLWFYAFLYDSRILFITLEGGMGLLVNWGDNSNFIVSVGGFHPRFSPPPLPFQEPPRIAVNILNESAARIRIEGYFAVTSNTVQFGARAELYFGFSALNVEGHLSFDALFQFDPFYFIFEFSVGLSVKVFGFGLFSISISGLLEGPSKWHIKGKAKWKITWLGPTIKINIDETWGEERQTELPPIEVFPLIEREFAAITNWEAIIPANKGILVSLRKLGEPEAAEADSSEPDTRPLVLHPVGKLRISQRKMPLNLVLEKFGNQRPADVNKLSATAGIQNGPNLGTTVIQEKFATGEFKDLDNTKKLSSPGFELYESGMELSVEGDDLQTSLGVKRIIRYETVIIDNNFKRFLISFLSPFHVAFTGLFTALFGHYLNGSSVTKSIISQHYKKQINGNGQGISMQPNLYSVATVADNKPIQDGDENYMSHFTSWASAEDYRNELAKSDPNSLEEFHVIPNTEANTAA
ncbi:DUF6603 domain-containing protein [Flavobacteriaceae bacterium 3-367]